MELRNQACQLINWTCHVARERERLPALRRQHNGRIEAQSSNEPNRIGVVAIDNRMVRREPTGEIDRIGSQRGVGVCHLTGVDCALLDGGFEGRGVDGVCLRAI